MPSMLATEGVWHLSAAITSFRSGSFWVDGLTAESFYKYLVEFQNIGGLLIYST